MWIPLDQLRVWPENYNQGDIGAIITSINRFGFNKALRVWNDPEHGLTIMAGNHSWLALQELRRSQWQPFGTGIRENGGGWELDCHVLDHLDYDAARAFAIADNRTAERASHDDAQLAALLQDLAAKDELLLVASGYDGDDLNNLLQYLNPLPPDGFPEYGDDIETEYRCPQCGYEWSGKAH